LTYVYVKEISACRVCGSSDLSSVINLGNLAVSGFVKSQKEAVYSCMPIVPDMGGGREAVELAGVGMTYSNIETATRTIRLEMEANGTEELAQAADKFKPEAFQNRIKEMVS
jgi:hypothetical protein